MFVAGPSPVEKGGGLDLGLAPPLCKETIQLQKQIVEESLALGTGGNVRPLELSCCLPDMQGYAGWTKY